MKLEVTKMKNRFFWYEVCLSVLMGLDIIAKEVWWAKIPSIVALGFCAFLAGRIWEMEKSTPIGRGGL